MRVLVLGGSGQLGTDINKVFTWKGLHITAPTRDELDLKKHSIGHYLLGQDKFDIIIYCAAYHDVEKCESEEKTTYYINRTIPRHVSSFCKDNDILFVYISTDYVFGGDSEFEPYLTTDTPDPLNVYGMSKYEGEIDVLENKGIVVRVASLYGSNKCTGKGGKPNFVDLMLKLGKEKDSVDVVRDQYMSPTYTLDVARGLYNLLITEFGSKKKYFYLTPRQNQKRIYHLVNKGCVSWAEFAEEIFKQSGIDCKVNRVKKEDMHKNNKAKTPAYSCLLAESFMPDWKDALKRYLESD